MENRPPYPNDPSANRGSYTSAQGATLDFERLSMNPGQLPQSSGEGIPPIASTSSPYQDVYVPEPQAPTALGAAGAPKPQPILPVELPPQAFLTSAMTIDFIDKKVVVCLRDNKGFVGVLRLYDQFANLTLCDAVERIFVQDPNEPKGHWLWCELPVGIITFRGENVSVVAEIDLDKEDEPMPNCTRAPTEQVLSLQKAEKTKKKAFTNKKEKIMKDLGFEPEQGIEA